MQRHMEARRTSQGRPTRVGQRAWRAFRPWLYWFHRWMGVVTCLFCVMWFATGLVMLYVPFPSWSDAERVATLPAVDIAQVGVTPDAALAAAGLADMPTTLRLEMFAATPVYRIAAETGSASVSAVLGDLIRAVSPQEAAAHLTLAFPGSRPALTETIEADQWTATRRFDPHRPLYRFALNDSDDTVVYVSSRTGEIVQNATFRERAWNWVGAVPHWIYFTPIRRDQELWRQVVMWSSGPLVIGAIAGLWIGILRLRPSAPQVGRSVSPYRGWMKWHHIAGLIGGLFVCTWIFSGWLSVNPFKMFARTELTSAQRAAFAGWTPESRLAATPEALTAAQGASDISFAWVDGRSLMLAHGAGGSTLRDAASGDQTTIPDDALVTAARRMYPASAITSWQRLTQETLYWYSHHSQRALPIIEIRFDDAAATSIYVDPATAKIAGLMNRSSRANRWLFDFLHDFDLPVLLRNRPARDILIWLLSFAGLIVSVSGVVIAWRTLKRSVR